MDQRHRKDAVLVCNSTINSIKHDKDVMAMEQQFSAFPEGDDTLPPPEKQGYLALSRTTDRVLQILLGGDLARLRADSVAESLGMSSTTLRRRLRADHTCYQFLLDRARQYRCEQLLRKMWLPGKCLADELGYLEVNSFYRAFRRWTGLSYSEYKIRYCL